MAAALSWSAGILAGAASLRWSAASLGRYGGSSEVECYFSWEGWRRLCGEVRCLLLTGAATPFLERSLFAYGVVLVPLAWTGSSL
eukprot:6446056-Pyramimonas_sp.AAC.1